MRITEAARERWSVRWLDAAQQDVRYAVRALRRTPAFTVAVVVTLALGIGANAAMSAVVDRLLFRPVSGLTAPASVHRIYFETTDRGRSSTSSWLSFGRYQDISRLSTSFSEIAAFNERLVAVGSGDHVRELTILGVSASFFDFFPAPPVRGRYFTAAEDRAPAGASVAILAHAFRLSDYGGRDVLGATLQVGNLATTIIGVASPDLIGINDAQPPRLFMPITSLGPVQGGPGAPRIAQGYDFFFGHMMARRRDGVSVAAASADATNAFRQSWLAERAAQPRLASLEEAQPRAHAGGLRPGAAPTRSLNTRTALWIAGVSTLVLLIAIANAANLWLGRALARRRETAVRLALGVSRGRLFSQFATESLIVAAIAAAGGALLAHFGGAAIYRMLAPTFGGLAASPSAGMLDGRSIALVALLTLVVATLTAIAPTLFAHRTVLAPALRSGARGTVEGIRLKTVLVVVQAALSLMLVVGALLFVRSLNAAAAMPLGYEPDRVLSVNRTMRGAPLSAEALLALRRTLLDAARAHPAVEAAAWRFTTPFGTNAQVQFTVDGVESVNRLGMFTEQEATAGYFDTMHTRILRGRAFTDQDRVDTPRVVVVSEGMARVLWPGQDPLGKCLRIGRLPAPCTSVIGVAEDVRLGSLTSTEHFHFYLAIDQYPDRDGSGMFLRVRGEPAAQAESIRRALQPLMPGMSYVTVQPLDSLVERGRQSWRVGATLFVAFGALALIVAAVGLYGVISYLAAQRMPEVGVRLALGARRRDIGWLILRPGSGLVAAGVLVGCVAALAVSRWFQPLLFQQSATDPAIYATAGVLLLLTGIAASIIPAIRAGRLDPTTVIRGQEG